MIPILVHFSTFFSQPKSLNFTNFSQIFHSPTHPQLPNSNETGLQKIETLMILVEYYTNFHATKIKKKNYPIKWHAHILYWFQCTMGFREKKNTRCLNTRELCSISKEAKPWPIRTTQGFNTFVVKMCIRKCSLKKVSWRNIVGM
jgi:hypothetical protein